MKTKDLQRKGHGIKHARRLLAIMFLAAVFLSAMFVPAYSQTKVQKKEQKVFAPVHQHLRARLIERLNLYVEYERTRQYEKLYDLLWQSVAAPTTLSREIYVEASKKTIAKGYRSVLLDFKPTSTLNISMNNEDLVRFNIWGTAKVDNGEKVYEKDAALEARWINGDWYFSGVADVIIDYGRIRAFPQQRVKQQIHLSILIVKHHSNCA